MLRRGFLFFLLSFTAVGSPTPQQLSPVVLHPESTLSNTALSELNDDVITKRTPNIVLDTVIGYGIGFMLDAVFKKPTADAGGLSKQALQQVSSLVGSQINAAFLDEYFKDAESRLEASRLYLRNQNKWESDSDAFPAAYRRAEAMVLETNKLINRLDDTRFGLRATSPLQLLQGLKLGFEKELIALQIWYNDDHENLGLLQCNLKKSAQKAWESLNALEASFHPAFDGIWRVRHESNGFCCSGNNQGGCGTQTTRYVVYVDQRAGKTYTGSFQKYTTIHANCCAADLSGCRSDAWAYIKQHRTDPLRIQFRNYTLGSNFDDFRTGIENIANTPLLNLRFGLEDRSTPENRRAALSKNQRS